MFLKRVNYSINKRFGKYFNFLKAMSYINKNKPLNDIILKNRLLVKNSKYLNYDDYKPGDYGVNPTIARDMHLNQSKLPTYSVC